MNFQVPRNIQLQVPKYQIPFAGEVTDLLQGLLVLIVILFQLLAKLYAVSLCYRWINNNLIYLNNIVPLTNLSLYTVKMYGQWLTCCCIMVNIDEMFMFMGKKNV